MAGCGRVAGMRDGLRGEPPMTRTARQVDVLAAFVASGGSVPDAAARVGIRPSTAKATWRTYEPDQASLPSSSSTVGVRRAGSSCRASSPPEVGCGVRPACRAEVTREAGQLGGGDPWVHDQHPRAALHDHRLVLEELAPVDGDPVRDRRQHATPTDAC